jgi:hypothetical protein
MKILANLNQIARAVEDLKATLCYPKTLWDVVLEKAEILEEEAATLVKIVEIKKKNAETRARVNAA